MSHRRVAAATTLLILTCLGVAKPLLAGPPVLTEEDLFGELPGVSVVSRFEQRLELAPASVTIISREMIEMAGAQNFVDIFRLVPGFQAYHVSNNRYGISYHGIGREFPNQIEVMVDGRSVYEPLFSSVSWSTLGIGLEDIDHIEIVRGSNAPAQGSNAFLGAINIVTRKPVQETGTSLSVTAGDTQARRLTMVNSHRVGEVDFRLSVGYDKNDGFAPVPDGEVGDGQELTYGNLRGTYTPNMADTVDLFMGIAHNRLGWGDSDHPDQYSLAHTVASFQALNWEHIYNTRHQIQVQAYHNGFRTSNLSELGPLYTLLGIDDATAGFLTAVTPAPQEVVALFATATGLAEDAAAAVLGELTTPVYGGYGELASERYDLQFQHDFSATDRIRGTWGVGVRYDELQTEHPHSFSLDIDEFSVRLFNHNEWRLSDSLALNAGAMVEDTHVGTLFSPRISANYQFDPHHALRLAYARGNRAPSLLEANEHTVARVGDVVFDILRIADPDLGEETIDSYELGYLYQSSNPALALDLRVFREEVRDVIDERRELSPPEVEIFGDRTFKRLENRDYWEFNGAEIQLNYQLTPSTFARLHYTSIDFDPEIAPPGQGFVQVYKDDRVAQHSGGLLIHQRLSPRWALSLVGHYHSGLRWEDGDGFDSITRVDAQLSYQFEVGAQRGKIRLIAQNLGDDYSEFNDNNRFATRFFIAAQMDFP